MRASIAGSDPKVSLPAPLTPVLVELVDESVHVLSCMTFDLEDKVKPDRECWMSPDGYTYKHSLVKAWAPLPKIIPQ